MDRAFYTLSTPVCINCYEQIKEHIFYLPCGLTTDKKGITLQKANKFLKKNSTAQRPTFHSLFHEGYAQENRVINRKFRKAGRLNKFENSGQHPIDL